MSSHGLPAERALTDRDRQDALRLIETSLLVAALPGMISPEARELAASHLRQSMHSHPSKADILAAIVAHLESYP